MNTLPRILYLYLTPRTSMLKNYELGRESSTFLYGLIELRQLGFQVDFFDTAYHHFTWLNYVFRPLENLLKFAYNYPRLGFRLQQALILLPKFKKYDIIFCTQDSAGLPIALFKKIGLIKNRVIYVTSNVTNAFEKPRCPCTVYFLKQILCAVDVIICSSKKEQEILQKKLQREIIFIADGIDTKFYKPIKTASYPIDILAVGKDYYRDYATLFGAVEKTHWKTVVVCEPENIAGLKIPANVSIRYKVSTLELRKLYAQAKILVLPMQPTDKPQGHTVLLSGMAMGKNIIASDVVGITTSYNLSHYSLIHLIPAHQSEDLRRILRSELSKPPQLLNNPEVRDSISTMHYAKKMAQITRDLTPN